MEKAEGSLKEKINQWIKDSKGALAQDEIRELFG
jgi:predicted XRE-type DNA-binding protein